MNALVLGSEGALGKSLCSFLTTKNINVIKWDIKLDTKHDLRNENCIDLILNEIDIVIFLAFDVGGSKYNVNTKEFIDNNMKIIINTFQSLSVNRKPFIYTTSCMSNMITNPYGSLKNISEHYVNLLEGINVKLWNVYSYEEISEKSHVIPDFIDSAAKNKYIKMNTQGNDVRQFIHCDDFSEAIFIIMSNYELFLKWIKSNSLKPIDISCYEWTSILEIALLIKDIYKEEHGVELDIIKGDNPDNHTNKTDPSLSILNNYWNPKIDLRKGIKAIINKLI